MPNESVKPWLKKTIGLDELPRKSRKVPELNVDTVRELDLYSYRILHEIKSDDFIEVLDFPVMSVGKWPDDLNLSREDMYGDDGR